MGAPLTVDAELDLTLLRARISQQVTITYADRTPAFRRRLIDEMLAEVGRRKASRLQQIDDPATDVLNLLGFVPTLKQSELISARELDVFYGGAAGGGKAVWVETPVPTPTGWTTMGQVKAGQSVLDDQGKPTRVLAVSELITDRESYRIGFDDGSVIYADADHLWDTFTLAERSQLYKRTDEYRAKRRATRASRATGKGLRPHVAARNAAYPLPVKDEPTGTTRTTREIAGTLRDGRRINHSIRVAQPVDLPEVLLPVDPYTLGVHLGDGGTGSSQITGIDPEILAEISAAGWRVKQTGEKRWTVYGLVTALRRAGVAQRKHVPPMYLRASTAQRLALLQGLMDTDGTADRDGKVAFTNTNRDLVDAVYELAVSLGVRPTIRERRAKLYGRDCGEAWVVAWTGTLPCFRLPRKLERLPKKLRGTQQWRFIQSVDRVLSLPMRCLRVDSPSSLFLIGQGMIPTHNSQVLVADAIVKAHRYPGIRLMIARGTYGELEESIFPSFDLLHWAAPLGAHWNGSRRVLSFRNGSVIRCRYLEGTRAGQRVQGGSYQGIYIDERTLLPPGVVENLRAERLRTRVGGPPVVGLRGTGNPGGPSHAELRSLYVDPTDYGKHLTSEGRRYIPSKVTDNPYLNPEYIDSLRSIPDPRRRAAMLEGRWDQFEGMMFDQWSPALHVVPAFPIPSEWRKYAGIDGGFAAPWSTIWMAVDRDGRGWIYDALRAQKVIEREQAARILLNEQSHSSRVEHRWADSAMWAVTGEAPSAADQYLDAGCRIEPAAKGPGSRVQRVRTMHAWLGSIDYATGQRLHMPPACPIHREAGEQTCPRLHILELTATESLRRTIRDLPRDPKDPEDVNTASDDHDYDALTYMLHMYGGLHTASIASPVGNTDLESIFADT